MSPALHLLITGPDDAQATLLLAHGAGAGMTSPFMEAITGLLAAEGIRVVRFEFAYMVERSRGGKRRPPPKAEMLIPEMRAALATLAAQPGQAGRVFVGGKSMGGRIASMIADSAHAEGAVAGLVCLGYPFHPPAKPDALRTSHLQSIACPALIVQGERDPFGTRGEVEGYALSPRIVLHWASDGDHDLGPRGASGFTRKGNLKAAAVAVATFVRHHCAHT